MLLECPIQSDRLEFKNLALPAARGDYFAWLKDPVVNQFLELRHQSFSHKELEIFISDMNASENNLLLGIYLLDGRHIGNIKLGPVHRMYSRSYLGFLIGDHNQWGKGYATEAISRLTDYAFYNLGLSAVWAGCYATNIASKKAFIKAGYRESARQEKYWKIGEKFIDNILLLKLKDDA